MEQPSWSKWFETYSGPMYGDIWARNIGPAECSAAVCSQVINRYIGSGHSWQAEVNGHEYGRFRTADEAKKCCDQAARQILTEALRQLGVE